MPPKFPFIILLVLVWVVPNAYSQCNDPVIRYDERSGKFTATNLPTLTKSPGAKKEAEWGIYLWEFGDGHYSFEEKPTHHYAKKGNYEVQLFLTPFYTSRGPEKYCREISVTPNGVLDQTPYDLKKRLAYIETNTANHIVPNHEIQMVMHYASNGVRNGHLFVFYNKKDEKKGNLKPLELLRESTPYQEGIISSGTVPSIIEKRLLGGAKVGVRNLYNEFEDVLAYRVEGIPSGGQQRLFLGFQANAGLTKFQDKDIDLTVTLVWAPDSENFDPKKNRYDHTMQILSVHDPNRVKVKPNVAYYRKNYPKTINYHVDFQNTAKGRVKDVRVAFELDKSLDVQSATMTGLDIDMGACPTPYRRDTFIPCYEIKKVDKPIADSLIFVFHNIDLEGRRGFLRSNKFTKAGFDFRLKSRDEKVGSTPLKANIIFQEVKPIETNTARLRWRHQTLFLRPGLSLLPSINGFEDIAEGIDQQLNIGIGYQNTPITTGKAYGGELSYTTFHFGRTLSDVYAGAEENGFPEGTLLIAEEKAHIQYLEAKAWLGYQVHSWLRGYAGLGLSLPLSGRVDVKTRLADAENTYTILESEDEASFGLLKSREPLSVFKGETELANSFGITGQLGVELGIMDVASLGVGREYRFFPVFYHKECATIASWQVFIRFQFMTWASKN
ncbi:MAG TPA: PKD domain-containing protein [Saprospiraceae bacterium]|nr:PKD domain-containing protein [Saprospiraceae bacterium]HMQ81682.1 PKD domain-containing protein [Saprospiraceae bacterium]